MESCAEETKTQDKRERQKKTITLIMKKNPTLTPAEIILSLLRQGPDGRYTNVFETLTSVKVLKLAYETIKSKPGNMVRGSTRETLDGISEE
jgi:hypothetical protein